MKAKLQNGDLRLIELVEHDTIPNKWAIMGTFKGDPKVHVLARVGEGEKDLLPASVVKLTAERVCAEIRSLYTTMATVRYLNGD